MHLLHERRSSATTYIGSHDNGYTPDLKSLISDGFGHKLILLPGYTEIATSIRELELDTLLIPNLFLADKLTVARTPKTTGNIPLPDDDFTNDWITTPPTPGIGRKRSVSVAAAVPLPETPGIPGTPGKKSKAARKRKSKSTNVSEVDSVSDTASSPPESIVVLSPAPPATFAPAGGSNQMLSAYLVSSSHLFVYQVADDAVSSSVAGVSVSW